MKNDNVAGVAAILQFLADAGFRQLSCPLCGGAPLPELWAFSGGAQAVCQDDDCQVFTWNPRKTARETLLESRYMEVTTDAQGRTTWR